jgi:hypothetical protein
MPPVNKLADLYNWPRIFNVSAHLFSLPLFGYGTYGAAMIQAGQVANSTANQATSYSLMGVGLVLMIVGLVCSIRSTSAANPVALIRRRALATVSGTCLGNGRAMSLLEQLTNTLEGGPATVATTETAEQLLAKLREVTLREAAQSILGKVGG